MQKDSILYESQNPAILRWLRPLEENNDLTIVHNDSTLPSKTTKQLISDIRCFQEKFTPDYVKKYNMENYCQETQDYLSLLESSISIAVNTSQQQEKSLGKTKNSKRPKSLDRTTNKGPSNSLKIPSELKEFWYPVEFSSRLSDGAIISFELFGESWVLWRDIAGRPACLKDQCAHRACPLSLGKITDGEVQCPYHGWQFDRQGSCTKIPSTTIYPNLHVRSLPVSELDGLLWVWPGENSPSNEIPTEVTQPPSAFEIHSELVLQVPVEHGLLLENLLDLAHAPFTHTGTFAKGWKIPQIVKFHASRLLGGRWDPYPIDMSFEPPCMVVSTIGLAQPGMIEVGSRAIDCQRHLHQLHVCLPSSEGNCRLLYRMSLDFLGWSKYVPGINELWRSVANKVLGEDLRLVVGQQQRLKNGANVWSNPVSYDKLGVRYRRWRNSMSNINRKNDAKKQINQKMTAAELFSLDD